MERMENSGDGADHPGIKNESMDGKNGKEWSW
jgi:hypothetical protein